MREIDLPPPNTLADLCLEASNESLALGLKCSSLAAAMKNLNPILANSTTVEPLNISEANLTASVPEKPKHLDKLIVLTIIIVFTVIGNLGVVLAILLRR